MRFSSLSEADQKKTVMAGSPITLPCTVSDPTGQVSWYTDGTKLLSQNEVDLQSQGNLSLAEQTNTGICHCESQDVDIQFAVKVKSDFK